MKTRIIRYFFLALCISLVLTACATRGHIYQDGKKVSKRKFLADQEMYQPYHEEHTLAAYHEFLQKYPRNVFTKRARDEILLLEFKPYEQQNTIEGYLEFKMLYPHNPNVKKANWHIEQVEINRYDSLDTIDGYREFIEKYPTSIFVNSAHERLQELTFRKQDRLLRKQYGFDLLKYRYRIRKAGASHTPLWNFQIFTHVRGRGSKALFVTRLLYSTPPDLQQAPQQEQLKTVVISKLLGFIAEQGRSAARLPKPFFEICSAPEGINANARLMLSYNVKSGGLRQLAAGRTQPQELLTASQVAPIPATTPGSTIVKSQNAQLETVRTSLSASAEQQTKISPTVIVRPLTDPAKIMHKVASTNTFTDAVLSRRWETKFQDGRTYAISVIEKHRHYDSHKSIRDVTVMRYLGTKNILNNRTKYAEAILHRRTNKAEDRYWYILNRGDAGRTGHIDAYRPDAENSFYLEQYVDLAPESESHQLLEIVAQDNKPAAMIKSTPLKTKPQYAWRRSMIDLERMVPLLIEYYDATGTLQKDVIFSWKQSFGIWYWDIAIFRNLADGSTTRITTTDIRINLDLPERDFLPGALSSRLPGR